MSQLLLKRSGANPLQEFLLIGGSILLVCGVVAFFQLSFLSVMGIHFSQQEWMLFLILGSAAIALEQCADTKTQEFAAIVFGAFGVVAGVAGLMVHMGVIDDVLDIVNVQSMTNSFLFLLLGGWGVAAAALSERSHS